MVERLIAAVGAKSGLPVAKLIHRLVRSYELVDDVDVRVLDVEDGRTVVEIVAVVEKSIDVAMTRSILYEQLGHLLLDKPAKFDLLVRETGVSGDARETVWRLGKLLKAVDGGTRVEASRRV